MIYRIDINIGISWTKNPNIDHIKLVGSTSLALKNAKFEMKIK